MEVARAKALRFGRDRKKAVWLELHLEADWFGFELLLCVWPWESCVYLHLLSLTWKIRIKSVKSCINIVVVFLASDHEYKSWPSLAVFPPTQPAHCSDYTPLLTFPHGFLALSDLVPSWLPLTNLRKAGFLNPAMSKHGHQSLVVRTCICSATPQMLTKSYAGYCWMFIPLIWEAPLYDDGNIHLHVISELHMWLFWWLLVAVS